MGTKCSANLLTEKVAEAESSVAELLQAAHYDLPTKTLPQNFSSSKTAGGSKKTKTKKATPLALSEKHAECSKPSKHQHPLQEFEGSSQAIVGSPLEPGSPHLPTVDTAANATSSTAASLPQVKTLTSLRHCPYAESDVARSAVRHYNQQLQEALKAGIMACLQQLHLGLVTAHEGSQKSVLQSSVDVQRVPTRGEGEEGRLAAICFTLGIQFFIPRVAISPSLEDLCSAVEEGTALVVGTSSDIDCWDCPSNSSTAPTMYSVLREDADVRGNRRKILVALRGELSEKNLTHPFKSVHILHCGKALVSGSMCLCTVHAYIRIFLYAHMCTAASLPHF